MAGIVGRVARTNFLKVSSSTTSFQVAELSNSGHGGMSMFRKALLGTLGLVGGGGAAVMYAMENSVKAVEMVLHPPAYPWSHGGQIDSLDHASIRRGYQVYKNVCAACHAMKYRAYRHLIDVCMTEEEAKAEAAGIMVEDGPDDNGNMYMRTGKIFDYFPNPYKNDNAARSANNGALPPDLSMIVLARHGGEDYIFSLLTGYCDAPAGYEVKDGLYYNPYFRGGSIAMAQALYNEVFDYEDGTPASASQMAKDVSIFLRWTCDPFHDERKRRAIKIAIVTMFAFFPIVYYKRHIFSVLKSRQFKWVPPKKW